MSNHLSPSTKALLAAAKQDGPSREKRAAMWAGVTGGLATHTPLAIQPQGAPPIAAPPPPPSAPVAAAKGGGLLAGASMKGAFIGALFGSAISIAVATFMLRSKPVEAPPAPVQTVVVTAPEKTNAPPTVIDPSQAGNGSTTTPNGVVDPKASLDLSATPSSVNAQSTGNSAGTAIANGNATSSKSSTRSHRDSAAASAPKAPLTTEELDNLLVKETALVAEARRDLLVGNNEGALKAVRSARGLEARQFEPEEMGMEAKALRALGRDSEAEKVENQRRVLYPEASLR